MTKYQIFAPNGHKVCIINAQTIHFFQVGYGELVSHGIFYENKMVSQIPSDWVAIPLDCIENED